MRTMGLRLTYGVRDLTICFALVFVISMIPIRGHADPAQHTCQKQAPSAVSPPHVGPLVTVTSCAYYYTNSPSNIPNYYLIVNIKYAASQPVTAVRFRFTINRTMTKYFVYRLPAPSQGGSATVQLIAPETSVTSLAVWVDQAQAQ